MHLGHYPHGQCLARNVHLALPDVPRQQRFWGHDSSDVYGAPGVLPYRNKYARALPYRYSIGYEYTHSDAHSNCNVYGDGNPHCDTR